MDGLVGLLPPGTNEPSAPPRKLNLSCAGCGYGVLRSTPPERCPMCQAENAWILSAARRSTLALTRA